MNEINNIKRSNGPPFARGNPGNRGKWVFKGHEARSPKPDAKEKPLLKMRDGPRGREPDTGLPATLIHPDNYRDSVNLCVSSVPSVVKQKTTDNQKSTEKHGAIFYALNKNSYDRYNCTAQGRMQEEREVQNGWRTLSASKKETLWVRWIFPMGDNARSLRLAACSAKNDRTQWSSVRNSVNSVVGI